MFCNAYAAEYIGSVDSEETDNSSNLNSTSEQSSRLDEKIQSLKIKIDDIYEKQESMVLSIGRSAELQKTIISSTQNLLEMTKQRSYKLEPVKLELIHPTNWYVLILPLVTIFIVVFGTILSIKTISIKSQESLSALSDSNNNQYKMNKENIDSEKERSQESIISENRQKWINTLREDISSLLSNMTQYKPANTETRAIMFNALWLEYYKIQLLLNPNEDDHKELVTAIKNCLSSIDADTEEFVKNQDFIIEISQKILKREWVRVKNFD